MCRGRAAEEVCALQRTTCRVQTCQLVYSPFFFMDQSFKFCLSLDSEDSSRVATLEGELKALNEELEQLKNTAVRLFLYLFVL